MKGLFANFSKIFVAFAMCIGVDSAYGAAAENPRASVGNVARAARSDARVTSRGNGVLTNVISRSTTNRLSSDAKRDAGVSRGAITSRAAAQSRITHRAATNSTPVVSSSARTAATTGVKARGAVTASSVRSALPANAAQNARAATGGVKIKKAGLARAASRATAVFTDISKIGGGYAQCREAYATCMDQFCAGANDTYRRCYCSSRYSEFRDMELAFDTSKQLLQRFEDNNLNAVDKTAAEVNAMYTATVGEAAIKNDVSGAQAMLTEVGDLLAGRKKPGQAEEKKESIYTPVSDVFSNMEDVWGSTDSFFDSMSGAGQSKSLSDMEGTELYGESHKQCLELVAESCQSEAVLNMAVSSYNIMITQDCNLYEKKIDSQREALMTTVRQAEKYLREARLEEYRSHNSADVNECISKVKNAILQDTACGEDYNRCLDYTGAYINSSTGDPIYTARFFKLNELIRLDGASADVLGQNSDFDAFLETKKMFATTALDSCRDIADTVWSEFKRSALIEIAQAQDEKIEEVKSSCVETMAECYDEQSGGLKSFDNTEAQYTGALARSAARDMCEDKVVACAALYMKPESGDSNGCKFDDASGRFTGNTDSCGLSSLLTYVASVDTIKMNEGCAEALTNYVTKELCAPLASETGRSYPWGCRNLEQSTLIDAIKERAKVYCPNYDTESADGKIGAGADDKIVENLITNIQGEISLMFSDECESLSGIWIDNEDRTFGAAGNYVSTVNIGDTGLTEFYLAMNAGTMEESTDSIGMYGNCYQNSIKTQCELQAQATDGAASYNEETGQCDFTDAWYSTQCGLIGGYFEDGVCYYEQSTGSGS